MGEPEPVPPASQDYVERVNRAIDHVSRHLAEPLRLEEVARAACFSPFHFHRVFRALLGETLQQFVKRSRLERALRRMSHEPDTPLTEIALAVGFGSSSDFSRSFKQRYGVPPSLFDLSTWRDSRRGDLQDLLEAHGPGTIGTPEGAEALGYARLPVGENPDGFEVELVDLPPRRMAYLRVLDPYRTPGVLEGSQRMLAWAEARGLAEGRWYGYQWEDPEVVDLADCRYDIALEVADHQPDGEIGRFDFPAMRVAQVEVRGGIDLELRALDWLFGTWLPTSGWVPDEQPCFEAWIGRPFAHGTEHFELEVQLPVLAADSPGVGPGSDPRK